MRFVPAIFPLFLIFSLIGCSSDKVPLVEKTCAEQQMRCSNDMIQKCHLAQWVDWTDCHAQELRCILVDAIPTCGHGSVMESDSGSLGDTEVPGIGDSNSDSMTFPDSASTDSSQYSGDDTDSGSSEPVDTDDTSPKGSDSADTTSVSDDDTGTDGDTGTVIDDSSTNGDTSYASSTDSDSETADSETQDSETADSETQDSETADSETQDSETADSETQDSETADSETQDSETADSEAQDSETVDSETVDPDTEPSVCGDGVRSSDEFCDDGNHTPLDGCAPDCQPSPSCFNSGPCEQICGDGIVVGNEECDDGNREGGDGCSESCETEADYTCSTGCIGINCTVSLKVYYRDFVEDDEDFQNDACGGGEEGTVENLLDAMGKPVASSIAANQCIFNLDKWYAGVPDISGELRLYRRFSPNTAYVNRYGENGEKWRDLMGKTYNGTPVFFPVDDLNTDMAPADIPPEYNSSGNWVLESDFVENASNHNFYFTSEMIYWFEYVKGADASIEIIGDDDVWVFVNGHLAIDLGGTHVPKSGSVTLDTPTASRFGLSDGNVYAIRIFHAERKKTGSTMQIQLDKIKSVQSVCAPSSTVIPPWNP